MGLLQSAEGLSRLMNSSGTGKSAGRPSTRRWCNEVPHVLKSYKSTRLGERLPITARAATPDILIMVRAPTPSVYGIEAKMFDAVESVGCQLHLQEEHCLKPIAET